MSYIELERKRNRTKQKKVDTPEIFPKKQTVLKKYNLVNISKCLIGEDVICEDISNFLNTLIKRYEIVRYFMN